MFFFLRSFLSINLFCLVFCFSSILPFTKGVVDNINIWIHLDANGYVGSRGFDRIASPLKWNYSNQFLRGKMELQHLRVPWKCNADSPKPSFRSTDLTYVPLKCTFNICDIFKLSLRLFVWRMVESDLRFGALQVKFVSMLLQNSLISFCIAAWMAVNYALNPNSFTPA